MGWRGIVPHAEGVPFLDSIGAPVSANIDSSTTGAFFQYVPMGYVGAPVTPGCLELGQTEGHYCAQTAREAIRQRVTFFATALEGVPRIDNPL
jgi:hypothetical protein